MVAGRPGPVIPRSARADRARPSPRVGSQVHAWSQHSSLLSSELAEAGLIGRPSLGCAWRHRSADHGGLCTLPFELGGREHLHADPGHYSDTRMSEVATASTASAGGGLSPRSARARPRSVWVGPGRCAACRGQIRRCCSAPPTSVRGEL